MIGALGRRTTSAPAAGSRSRARGERLFVALHTLAFGVLGGSGFASILLMRQANWRLEPGELDVWHALPDLYWAVLVAGIVAGVALLFSDSELARTASVAGIAFLLGPAFLLGLYPGVAGWDTYLHASAAGTLLNGQGVAASNFYAGQYPGTATLLAVLAGAMGTTPIEAGIVVTAGAGVSLALLWIGIARHWLSSRAAAWSALAVVGFTPAIMTNDHISPWILSYGVVWGVLLLLLIGIEAPHVWPRAGLCALLLGGGTIVLHPFMPIVTTALAGGCALLAWHRGSIHKRAAAWFAASLAVAATAWTIYVATRYFGTGVAFLRNILLGTQDVADQWTGLSTYEVLRRASTPAFGIIMIRWAFYGLAGLLAFSGLALRRTRRDVTGVFLLVAAGVASALVGFASEAPWVQRFLYLAPPLLVLAASIAVTGWAGKSRFVARLAPAGALLVCAGLIASAFVWHPPSLVSTVHPSQAAFVVWPQEQAASRYTAQRAGSGPARPVVASDLQTAIIYSYFDPQYQPFRYGISMGSNLHDRVQRNPFLFEGDLVIRSGRQEIVSYAAQDLDPALWGIVDESLGTQAARVYDNGFVRVYRK